VSRSRSSRTSSLSIDRSTKPLNISSVLCSDQNTSLYGAGLCLFFVELS
jgi:hypothetical protein